MAVMFADQEIFNLLESFGEDLLLDIDKSLTAKGHGSKAVGGTQSARIIGSGNFKIIPTPGGVAMNFYLNDYWYYLEYGRGPTKTGKSKKPFEKTLAGKLYASGWDVGKGINAREWYKKNTIAPDKRKSFAKLQESVKAKKMEAWNEKLGDYEGLRKILAYAVAGAIHRKGTIKRFGYKGSNFLSDVLQDGRFDKLSEKLSDMIGSRIVIDISNAFKQ